MISYVYIYIYVYTELPNYLYMYTYTACCEHIHVIRLFQPAGTPRTKLCKSRTTYSGTTYCSQFAADSMGVVPKSWTQAPVYSSQGLQAASWGCLNRYPYGTPEIPWFIRAILHHQMAFLEAFQAFRIFGQTRVLRMWRCHEATVRPGVVMTAPGAQGTAKIDHSGCWGLPIYWMMLTNIYVRIALTPIDLPCASSNDTALGASQPAVMPQRSASLGVVYSAILPILTELPVHCKSKSKEASDFISMQAFIVDSSTIFNVSNLGLGLVSVCDPALLKGLR